MDNRAIIDENIPEFPAYSAAKGYSRVFDERGELALIAFFEHALYREEGIGTGAESNVRSIQNIFSDVADCASDFNELTLVSGVSCHFIGFVASH